MAANRYSAFIDIGVLGGRGAEKVLKTTEQIRDVLQSISKTPLAIDDGRRTSDVFKQLAKNVNDFARGIANGQRQLANTELGLQRQASALSKVSTQAKRNGALYKNAIEGQVKAEQRLRLVQLDRLDVETKLFARGKTAFNESFRGVPELISLGPKISNTTASLEVYRNELQRTLAVVDISSNEFRALEEAIAGVDQRLSSAFLSGQTSKITPKAGPATDLGSVNAFKQREQFEKNIEKQLIRQLAVEQRINQANLDDVQKAKLRNDLAEATNQLAANELTISQQITSEVERQRMSLERAARARKKEEGTSTVLRTGQFSPLTAPKRAQNIQNSAVIIEEKLNTLAAKGVDVATAKSRVEKLILDTKDSGLTLDIKSLNLLDDELNALRQIVKLENGRLSTLNAQERARKKGKKGQEPDKPKAFTQTRLGSAALGAAFPALFGGGPGGILGGGIGEFALGPLGGVIGSAIGSALENAARQVAEFGNALRKPTENLEALARAAGLAGTAQNQNIAISQFLGAEEIGGTIAAAEVEGLIGSESVQTLKDLSTESEKLGNNFNKIGTRLQSAFAPLLNQLARFGTAITGGAPQDPQQRLQEVQSSIETRSSSTRRRGSGQLSRLREEEEQLLKLLDSRSQSEKDINAIIQGRQKLLDDAATLEEDRLSLTRVGLATRQGQLEVDRVSNDLQEIENKLNQDLTPVLKRQLNIQKDKLKAQENTAKAARDNAITLARIAVERDRLSQLQKTESLQQNIFDTQVSILDLTKSDADTYKEKLTQVDKQYETEKEILRAKTDSQLLDVVEKAARLDILRNYFAELVLLQNKKDLQDEIIRQNEVIRKDSAKQFQDQLALQDAQAGVLANQQIRSMSPDRIGQFLGSGFGFFDGSTKLEDDLLLKRTEQLKLYQIEITNLQERIDNLNSQNVNPEVIKPLQNQLDQVKRARNAYAQFEPQIDAARVAQARFNEALAITTPITASLVNGISEVVQGTKTAKEAFADFLRTIGDTLVKEGTRMIAMYTALGIFRAFAGLSGGSETTPPQTLPDAPVQSGLGLNINGVDQGIAPFGMAANGGPVRGGSPYLVGERGPELFVPGTNGGILRNEDLRSAMSRQQSSAPAMNFSFETTNIGGTEYVSREQLEAAMAVTRKQAANDGAKRGMNMTLDKMQHSPSTRRRVGI